jgi:glycosyltransferase involved in cell wall biosynthesis
MGIGADYEIILVDDGSADDTGRIADEIAAVNKRVRVVHHPHNQGYGAALQSGFRAAAKDLVFYSDGDGQFDLNELPPLLPLMQQYDIVSCYRMNRQDNLSRRIMGRLWTRLTCLLFSLNIRDIDCAFKLYKRDIFNHIKMESTGALISTEILARASRAGYRITQKGVHHRPRTAGRQTGANPKVVFRAFVELLRLRRRILKGQ